MIVLRVNHNEISVIRRDNITAGTVGLQCSVSFIGSEWNNLQKTVVFKGGNGIPREVAITTESIITVPHEALASANVTLYVGAVGSTTNGQTIIRTAWKAIDNIKASPDGVYDESATPSPSVVAQIQALAQQAADDAEDAEEAAESAQESAEAVEDRVPAPTSGDANKVLKVKSDGSGTEWGAGGNVVSVSSTGTATDTVSYITIDGVEKKLAGGSSSGATWGQITGTLSNQTDLQTALNGKQSAIPTITVTASQVISQDPITIQFTDAQAEIINNNNNPIIMFDASGISSTYKPFLLHNTLQFGSSTKRTLYTSMYYVDGETITGTSEITLTYTIDTKIGVYVNVYTQDKLVSGTNIKTVGGQSLIGSGNVPVGMEKYVVTLSYDSETETYTADHYAADIYAAYTAGKYVVCNDPRLEVTDLPLLSADDDSSAFSCVSATSAIALTVIIDEDSVNLTAQVLQPRITASGLLKGNGSGIVTAAVAGTDYMNEFVVTITWSGSTYTADKTNAEIWAAYNSGNIVIARDSDWEYYLTGISKYVACFTAVGAKTSGWIGYYGIDHNVVTYNRVKVPSVINNVTSTSTTDALSANMGKELQDQITHLESVGRFLSLWNAVTGLPTTNPTTSPYAYKTGDYFRVSNVATGYHHALSLSGTTTALGTYSGAYTLAFTIDSESVSSVLNTVESVLPAMGDTTRYTATGTLTTSDETYTIASVIKWFQDSTYYIAICDADQSKLALISASTTQTDTLTGGVTNYRPNGASYTTGVASSTVETATLGVGYVYYYDGTQWMLQSAGGSSSGATWGQITGALSNQTDLQTALNGKQSAIPTITIDDSQIISEDPVTIQLTSAQAAIVENEAYDAIWGVSESLDSGLFTRNTSDLFSCVYSPNEYSVKIYTADYNSSTMQCELYLCNLRLDRLIGPYFSASQRYAAGDLVLYPSVSHGMNYGLSLFQFNCSHLGAWSDSDVDRVDISELITDLHSTKQDTLISGTNIKTVGGQSLLGSGNVPVGMEKYVVTLTRSGSTYTADHYYADIKAAYDSGKQVVCRWDGAETAGLATIEATLIEIINVSGYQSAWFGGVFPSNEDFVATVQFLITTDTVTGTVKYGQPEIDVSGLLKGDGSGGITAAVAGTDYVAPSALDGKIDNPASKSNGQVLTYNATSGEWEAQTPSGDVSLGITGATVGQNIRIKTVDANGKPTAWETANIECTLTVTCATKDGVTVTGQTVTLRKENSSGQVVETKAYEGQPVSFILLKGFEYYVSVSNTLAGHFAPTTASGVIAANASVTLTYDDASSITTFQSVKEALTTLADPTVLIGNCEIEDTWIDENGTSYSDPMMVVAIQTVTDADGDTHTAAIMQRKWATKNSIVFDAPEAEEATEETAQADVYYAALDGSTFTKLNLSAGDTIPYSEHDHIYHNGINFDNNMIQNGYNRWGHSAYRQYLNSSAAVGAWWSAQHVGDCSPSSLSTTRGYKAGCSAALLAAAKPIKIKCSLNTVTDGGVMEETVDTFWLPSGIEMFGTSNSGEGEYFPYWKTATGLTTPSDAANSGRIQYALESSSSAQLVRLRSPNRSHSCRVWLCDSSGQLSSGGYARGSYRGCPACAIY